MIEAYVQYAEGLIVLLVIVLTGWFLRSHPPKRPRAKALVLIGAVIVIISVGVDHVIANLGYDYTDPFRIILWGVILLVSGSVTRATL
ncbi:MAG: hypothetical protein M9921_11640 [Fimbriimonadaceae bacterium]|nr:hypothetical protein [Fimbriimonadaceae bacterium]